MKKELCIGVICVILTGLALFPLVLPDFPWPVLVRDTLVQQNNTGAPNLVAAVYLGYRAYDTLGELVVLLASLSAAIGLIRGKGAEGKAGEGRGPLRRAHTDIIDLTAGKLSPIVLLFGCYLMFYGYESPGGGFQGGVVLASGIIFIALGRREGGIGRLDSRRSSLGSHILGRVELVSFLVILLLCLAGPLGGYAILENPVGNSTVLSPAAYIIAFNMVIGLKVASGIAMTCLLLMEKSYD
jgi:multicomponent Na+:H+ antiporter subunit B